jgi:hypothetical protein
MVNHLERDTSGANDYSSPELDHRDRPIAQDIAYFMPTAKMSGLGVRSPAKTTEIDDPLETGSRSGPGHILCSNPVEILE